MPYKIAFFSDDGSNFFAFFDRFIDTVFFIDIVLNFVFEYDDPVTHKPVSSYSMIAKNYLSTWFLLDFIAWFPFDFLMRAFFIKSDFTGY